jgi:hypothetical protein
VNSSRNELVPDSDPDASDDDDEDI